MQYLQLICPQSLFKSYPLTTIRELYIYNYQEHLLYMYKIRALEFYLVSIMNDLKISANEYTLLQK